MAAQEHNPATVAGATAMLALGLFALLAPLAEAAGPAAKTDQPVKAQSDEPRRIPGQPLCAALPRSPWISLRELETRLAEGGLVLVKLRFGEDRCYAATARDAGGAMHLLAIHPVTAEIVARSKF